MTTSCQHVGSTKKGVLGGRRRKANARSPRRTYCVENPFMIGSVMPWQACDVASFPPIPSCLVEEVAGDLGACYLILPSKGTAKRKDGAPVFVI